MKLTPLHLEILMHYNCSNNFFRASNQTIIEFHNDLVKLNLLDINNGYFITDKGKVWLEHILETPMPVQEWVWE